MDSLFKIETRQDTTHYVLAKNENEAKKKYINLVHLQSGVWSIDIRNCIRLYLIK